MGPVWDLFCSAFFSFRFLGFVAFNLFARPIAGRARCAFAERGERGERRQAGRTQEMGFIRMGFVRIYRPECVCMCLRELVFVCLRACVMHVRTLSERARHSTRTHS